MSDNNLIPVTVDTKTMRNLTKAAQRANNTATVSARKARIASSVATFVAVRDGFLGGTSPLWKTQGDYAADLGVTNGNVTGLKRLGRCLSLGLDPHGKHEAAWNILSTKAGTKAVGEVLDADDVTLVQVLALVDTLTAEKVETKRAPGKSGSEKGGGGEQITTSTMSAMDAAKAALDVLAKVAKDLTADEWIGVSDRLGSIVEKENTIRAKVAATPRTVAKRVSKRAA